MAGKRWELRVSLEWHLDDLTAWVRVGREREARLELRAQGFPKRGERHALEAWDLVLGSNGYHRIGDSALDGGGTLTFCKALSPADVERERGWLDGVMKRGVARKA